MRAKMKLPVAFACVVMLLAVLALSGCEKRDWGKAQQTNSIEGYKSYLAKYPKGKFAKEANDAVEKLTWEKAKAANSLDAVQAFIDGNPNSPFIAEAQELMNQLKMEQMISWENEAKENLALIAAALETYMGANGKYISCMASPAEGGTDSVADLWMDAGGFTDIGFTPSTDVRYKYEVMASKNGKTYKAIATGDLDENGVPVTFTITNDNPEPVKSPEEEH
jgi:predicted secreted protein